MRFPAASSVELKYSKKKRGWPRTWGISWSWRKSMTMSNRQANCWSTSEMRPLQGRMKGSTSTKRRPGISRVKPEQPASKLRRNIEKMTNKSRARCFRRLKRWLPKKSTPIWENRIRKQSLRMWGESISRRCWGSKPNTSRRRQRINITKPHSMSWNKGTPSSSSRREKRGKLYWIQANTHRSPTDTLTTSVASWIRSPGWTRPDSPKAWKQQATSGIRTWASKCDGMLITLWLYSTNYFPLL